MQTLQVHNKLTKREDERSMSSITKVPWNSLLQFRAATISYFSSALLHFTGLPVFVSLFIFLSSPRSANPPLISLLALPPFIALLEFPQPAAPQVLPRDKQASLVCHHSTLARGVVVCTQEQVLLPWLDFGAFACHILGTNPQQLVSTADAVLALFVDWDYVDGELPPLTCFVPF